MSELVLGPIFDRPLHPAPWCDYGRKRGTTGCPRYDYRVTNTFDGKDLLNGGTHRAVDAGNAAIGWPVLAPADCRVRARYHFDGALGLDLDLGHGLVLTLWHLSWLAFYVPVVQGKSTDGAWHDVKRGQVIGKTGNTGARLPDGSPMPAHTHAELRRDGVLIDPEAYLLGAPIPLDEEDDMQIPATSEYLVGGVVGEGNRLRVDPFTTEGSKIIGDAGPDGIGEAKAYAVRVYEREVPGQPYELKAGKSDKYALVGVFGRSWYVAELLLTNVKLTAAGLQLAPKADCSAELRKISGARTAVAGAKQALEAVEEMLG